MELVSCLGRFPSTPVDRRGERDRGQLVGIEPSSSDLADQVVTVEVWHADVAYQYVGNLSRLARQYQPGQGLGGTFGGSDMRPVLFQQAGMDASGWGVIVDHHHPYSVKAFGERW